MRKLSDGQTDRQTDECDFIGRCTTNVEHPITVLLKITILIRSLIEAYNIVERGVKLNDRTMSLHHKILIDFADNIG